MHPVSGRQHDGSWHDAAACRGPNHAIFFPPTRLERRTEKRRREQRAKEICETCPVLQSCRSYALEIGEQHGIWGGLTAKERRQLVLTGDGQR
jgi:WhiB family redox-sensing transcriptional regulator